MAKFDIEKHLGQEACQCTCSIFFFVEKFLKPMASLHDTVYHIYQPPKTGTLDNDLYNIECYFSVQDDWTDPLDQI